jgi:ribosomal protein S18 acetylase RimI-like enzyme
VPYTKAAIRPFRSEDEPVLFGLARMVFGERSGWDDRGTIAVLETEEVFVAEVEGVVAGYVALQPAGETVRIDRLLVAPAHEAAGVGNQLVEWAEGYAIARGATRLQVAAEPDNVRARDFYRRRGFVPVADELLELVLPQR